MRSSLDNYLASHSSLPSEALEWLEKQTNIRTNYPQMLSGSVQGQLLKMLVEISGAKRVLEIGSFTGYSAICLASGLPADGHLDALEINDELEDLMREAWSRAGLSDKITLHLGDAISILNDISFLAPVRVGGKETMAAHGHVNGGTAGAAGGGMERSGSFSAPYPDGSENRSYDLVFIDANKRQYDEYFELVLPLLRPGGLIVADDVLWDGKVYTEPVPHDAQTEALLAFNDKMANDPRVEVVVLPLRDGISLIRKK